MLIICYKFDWEENMQQLVILVISSFLLVSNAFCMELDKVIKRDPGCPIALLQDDGKYLKELIAIENNGDFSSDLYTAEKTLQNFCWHNDHLILKELCDQRTLKLAQSVARRHEDYKKLYTALIKYDFHEAIRVIDNNKYCLNAAYPRVLLSLVENSSLAKFLIARGANVNQKDVLGKTSLFYEHHWADVWPCLLQHGARVNEVDNQGNTSLYDLVAVSSVLQYADVCSHEKQIIFLFKKGASPDVINKNGKTYFDIIKTFNVSKKNYYQYLAEKREFSVKEMCVLQSVQDAGNISCGEDNIKSVVVEICDEERDFEKDFYDAADRRDFAALQNLLGIIGKISMPYQDAILRKIIKNHDNESLRSFLSIGFSPEGLNNSDEGNLLLLALRCNNAQAIELLLQNGYDLAQAFNAVVESIEKGYKECTKVLNAFCFNTLKPKDTRDTIDFFA